MMCDVVRGSTGPLYQVSEQKPARGRAVGMLQPGSFVIEFTDPISVAVGRCFNYCFTISF